MDRDKISLVLLLAIVCAADANSSTGAAASIDGSFINGSMTLTKTPQKNGFHKHQPVVVVVDKSSHYTYVFQKQASDKVAEVLRASNAIGKDESPTPAGPYKVTKKLKWPS